MAESRHERIAAAIEALLRTIVADGGTTYWLTPTQVQRVDAFLLEHLDTSYQTIYLIRPGDEEAFEDTAEEVRREMELYILLATKAENVTANPFINTSTITWTTQSRMIRDVETILYNEVLPRGALLGNLAENIMVPNRNRQVFVDGWTLAELRVLIKYSHLRTDI